MSDFRRLSDSVMASPQISLADLQQAYADGVRLVINNRPDGEDPGQLPGAEVEAAAHAAGMDYVAIPITRSGFSGPQIQAMADALASSSGPVLAYCRSGTRSTLLWALAQASSGVDPEELSMAAAQAGYDVAPVRAMMDILAGADKA
ncbi:MAG: TIGR01244 family sulfur transferase [Sphingomonadaceae bacterium]|nr:TIGR01244 family phosphatase [Sphingomonadaceae bacterium]